MKRIEAEHCHWIKIKQRKGVAELHCSQDVDITWLADHNSFLLHTPDGKRRLFNLLQTPQPFGGHRVWLQCPMTKERAQKLYLPAGAEKFGCVRAHNLSYKTQNAQNAGYRLLLKRKKMEQNFNIFEGNWSFTRPKGMHRRTHRKAYSKLMELHIQIDQLLREKALL